MRRTYDYFCNIRQGLITNDIVDGRTLMSLENVIYGERSNTDGCGHILIRLKDHYLDECNDCKNFLKEFVEKYGYLINDDVKENDLYIEMLEILGLSNRFKMTKSARKF